MTDVPKDYVAPRFTKGESNLIHAFTEFGGYKYYPQYINVAERNGNFEILMRGKEHEDESGFGQGSNALMTLTPSEFAKLIAACSEYLWGGI